MYTKRERERDTYIYICIYTETQRERERDRDMYVSTLESQKSNTLRLLGDDLQS